MGLGSFRRAAPALRSTCARPRAALASARRTHARLALYLLAGEPPPVAREARWVRWSDFRLPLFPDPARRDPQWRRPSVRRSQLDASSLKRPPVVGAWLSAAARVVVVDLEPANRAAQPGDQHSSVGRKFCGLNEGRRRRPGFGHSGPGFVTSISKRLPRRRWALARRYPVERAFYRVPSVRDAQRRRAPRCRRSHDARRVARLRAALSLRRRGSAAAAAPHASPGRPSTRRDRGTSTDPRANLGFSAKHKRLFATTSLPSSAENGALLKRPAREAQHYGFEARRPAHVVRGNAATIGAADRRKRNGWDVSLRMRLVCLVT